MRLILCNARNLGEGTMGRGEDLGGVLWHVQQLNGGMVLIKSCALNLKL